MKGFQAHPLAGRVPGCRRGLLDPDLPFQQGQLDGLCGLYSVINALRLVARPHLHLEAEQCYSLFGIGVDFLASRDKLAGVVQGGTGSALRRRLLAALAANLRRDSGLPVRTERPFRARPRASHAAVEAVLEAALDRGAVALVTLSGLHEHFTVIRSYRASQWRLYDSGGLHWLKRSACGSPHSSKRHRIDPASIETVEVIT